MVLPELSQGVQSATNHLREKDLEYKAPDDSEEPKARIYNSYLIIHLY